MNYAVKNKKQSYIPALGLSSFNKLYDRLSQWAFHKSSFHQMIQESVRALGTLGNLDILELGCGPARLAIFLKNKNPRCHILAVDQDPSILELAKSNAEIARVKINFLWKNVTQLSLPKTFDRIYSTLLFHHLTTQEKKQTLKKSQRLLKKEGVFVLTDFCASGSWQERLKFLPVQLLDGFESTTPHTEGWLEKNLPNYFLEVTQQSKISTFLGPVGVFVCKHHLKLKRSI